MKPTSGPWKNDSMEFSAGWRCIVNLPGGRSIDVADPRDRETTLEDAANAEAIADVPTMLRLLRDAHVMWVLNPNPPKGSLAWEIGELLKKYEQPLPGKGVSLGTAAALIDKNFLK